MTRTTFQQIGTTLAVLGVVMLGATALAGQQARASTQAVAQAAPAHQHGHQANPDEAQALAMMARQKEMMAEMHAMDQRLTELVARMKSATGPAKIEAIEAVIAELVSQRSGMRDGMMTMQSGMMGHMMGHMAAAGMATGCPMMVKK